MFNLLREVIFVHVYVNENLLAKEKVYVERNVYEHVVHFVCNNTVTTHPAMGEL